MKTAIYLTVIVGLISLGTIGLASSAALTVIIGGLDQ